MRSTPARTAAELLRLGLPVSLSFVLGLMSGGAGRAQSPAPAPAGATLYFSKPAGTVGGSQTPAAPGSALPPAPAHPTLFFSRQPTPAAPAAVEAGPPVMAAPATGPVNTPVTSGPVNSPPVVTPVAAVSPVAANTPAADDAARGGIFKTTAATPGGQAGIFAPPVATAPGSDNGPPTQLTTMQAVQPNEKVPAADQKAPGEEDSGYAIQLEPPGIHRLTQLDSEASLMERMRQEARQRTPLERIEFPQEPILSPGQRYVTRAFPPHNHQVEPAYVMYDPLYFQEINSERYGWDFGLVQPIWSALAFYKDLAMVPARAAIYSCGNKYDSSAGYCLPGDPVPYYIRPLDIRVSGLAAETATVLGILALFP